MRDPHAFSVSGSDRGLRREAGLTSRAVEVQERGLDDFVDLSIRNFPSLSTRSEKGQQVAGVELAGSAATREGTFAWPTIFTHCGVAPPGPAALDIAAGLDREVAMTEPGAMPATIASSAAPGRATRHQRGEMTMSVFLFLFFFFSQIQGG